MTNEIEVDEVVYKLVRQDACSGCVAENNPVLCERLGQCYDWSDYHEVTIWVKKEQKDSDK